MNTEIVLKLDAAVVSVISSHALHGFEKAHLVAKAITELKELLTPEYMAPIMALQGSKLGFRTDLDKKGGYTIDVVKTCLIDAVLFGLQPYGNQFNIIAGNMYPTKEGLGAVLNRKDFFPNLKKSIITGLPRINADKGSAAFDVQIKWNINGSAREEIVPIPIKIDQYASVDSMVGKATRKARAWLLGELTGVEIQDGEVEDANARVIESRTLKKTSEEKQHERLMSLIAGAQSVEELAEYKKNLTDDPDEHNAYEERFGQLMNAKNGKK